MSDISQYGALLSAAGFNASDAATQKARTERKLGEAIGDVQLAGEDERRQLNNSWEDRGMFNSGGRGMDIAREQGREASKIAQLQAAAADDTTDIESKLQKAIAQQKITDQQLSDQKALQGTQQDIYNTQLDLLRKQGTSSDDIANARLEQQKAQHDLQMQLLQKQLDIYKQTAGARSSINSARASGGSIPFIGGAIGAMGG